MIRFAAFISLILIGIGCATYYGVVFQAVRIEESGGETKINKADFDYVVDAISVVAAKEDLVPIENPVTDTKVQKAYFTNNGSLRTYMISIWVPVDQSWIRVQISDWANSGRKSETLRRLEAGIQPILDARFGKDAVQGGDAEISSWIP